MKGGGEGLFFVPRFDRRQELCIFYSNFRWRRRLEYHGKYSAGVCKAIYGHPRMKHWPGIIPNIWKYFFACLKFLLTIFEIKRKMSQNIWLIFFLLNQMTFTHPVFLCLSNTGGNHFENLSFWSMHVNPDVWLIDWESVWWGTVEFDGGGGSCQNMHSHGQNASPPMPERPF